MHNILQFSPQLTALEFFSGIGLARAGMAKAGIKTIWANDIDHTKCAMYSQCWGDEHLVEQDVHTLDPDLIPQADIAWASSPCTNLSLAGNREGLVSGKESSAFFGFIKAIEGMSDRAPRALVLENVIGLATSNNSDDFRLVCQEFNRLGYSCDAYFIDARHWLPQSRPRMFVVGLKNPLPNSRLDSSLRPEKVSWIHSDPSLITHVSHLNEPSPLRMTGLAMVVENIPEDDKRWWNKNQVQAFIDSLAPHQAERLQRFLNAKEKIVRTAYRRTRSGVVRWEIREEEIAGCLRTARGGSSRQAVVICENGKIEVRWMTGTEYARLQGADSCQFSGFSDAQIRYAFGDAVAVPVVTWLIKNAVKPALMSSRNGVNNNGNDQLLLERAR